MEAPRVGGTAARSGGYPCPVGVVTPERKPAAPPRRELPPASPPPPPRRPLPWGLIALLVTIALAVVVPGWLTGLLPSLPNPFASTTVDRSQPALLRSVQGLEQLRAATGHFEVVVDIERDTALPRAILGERTLFVAVGSVDATVDLSSLDGDRVVVSQDGRRAVLTLPQPQLTPARLDVSRSHVYDRDRGLLDRVGSLFGSESDDRELYVAAQRKIDAAAMRAGLVAEARKSAAATLETLVRSLGFESVGVRFD